MNYTLGMYYRQKPVKKSILKFRKAQEIFEKLLADCRKAKLSKQDTKWNIEQIKYHCMPEMTEARKRVLKMI